jgi:membrane protease YdiL (CAAX protease family)
MTEQMNQWDAKKVFTRVGWGLFAWVAIGQLLSIMITLIASKVAPDLLKADWFVLASGYGIVYLIGFPVMLAIFRAVPSSKGTPQALGDRRQITMREVLFVLLVSLGIETLLGILTERLDASVVGWLRGLLHKTAASPAGGEAGGGSLELNLLLTAVIAPIMEEVIFRKLLYQKLIPYGGRVYVLTTALLFALAHAKLFQLFFAFALGIIFGLVYYFGGKLWHTIFLHMSCNVISSVIGQVLGKYAPDKVSDWNLGLVIVAGLGLIAGVIWFFLYRKELKMAVPASPLRRKRVVLGNPGMLSYILFLIALMLFRLYQTL